jgi:hypothetical protein
MGDFRWIRFTGACVAGDKAASFMGVCRSRGVRSG